MKEKPRPAVQASIRLNKFLCDAGLGSRRSVDKIVNSGAVVINGVAVRNPAFQVDPETDDVQVDGHPVTIARLPTYLVLNKPPGYITTARDEKNRRTVFSLLHLPIRVFPVGRLDRESEGLLLLTNDGELAYRLMHPKYKVEKKYIARVNKTIADAVVKKFAHGVTIDHRYRVRGEITFPHCELRRECFVTISEGRNRQIRKMFAAAGLRVTWLVRTQIGPLQLGNLKPGAWRYLTKREIGALKSAVRMTDGNQK